MSKREEAFQAATGRLVGVAIWFAISAALVMVAWNALVPAVFAGPALTYWQAVALTWLAGVPGRRPPPRETS